MKRIFLTLCCALALAVTACAADWPAWAEEALSWGRERGISQTYLAAPEALVTRGDAAALLYQAAGSPAAAGDCPFTDVSGDLAPAVTWAAEQGCLTGVGDGRYDPDTPVTREEFAAILYRQAGSPAVSGGSLGAFSDRESLGGWAEIPMLWCVQTGLMKGRTPDTLAPRDTITVAEAASMLQRADVLPDVSGIREDLEVLTAAPRPIGSEGEAEAADYIARRFAEMGYAVTRQPYTDESGRTGTNVIAVKEAVDKSADILVLSAHHDSVANGPGANDDASGVAALLYAAEALKDAEGAAELRFISFTDEENGKNGSRAYVESLSGHEKARMIGDIQFDMLGGLGAGDTVMATMDGEGNWVSDLLREKDPSLARIAESASDHVSFQLAQVPSVMLTQSGRGYLYHTAADTADQLNPYAVAKAAETAVEAAEHVMENFVCYWEALRMAPPGYTYTYRQRRQNVIYFGASRADTEAYVGAAGELVDTDTISGEGWTDTYETYRYDMCWFDADAPMSTYYQYRNGYLENIEIRPAETGYTAAEVRDLIQAMYGAPAYDGADSTGWEDVIYSKYITLLPGEGTDCAVTVSSYSLGLSNVLSSYAVTDGQADIADREDAAVWAYLCSILPVEYRQKIARFDLFTDGCSNVLAYTAPIEREDGTSDNTRFSIAVDYYDVYDENGERRDWSKLTYTILHEYGHVLLEDETQVDLTAGTTTHDPAGYVEGSFRKGFYDAFWAEAGNAAGNFALGPTDYVSQYAANYFHEDIADTFAVFVLGGEPEGDTVAAEKLRFFWDDPDMAALRAAVRENLGLAG